MNKKFFTLAEILIVIGVIGIVAVLTIPTLVPLIKDKVDKNRKEVIEDRLIQGMNQLNTLDDGFNASQYTDTEGFVRALSKYYKMSQICGATELDKCFPYASINYTKKSGEEAKVNLADLKTTGAFQLSSEEWFVPAGFISAQGTPFIMFLNKNCLMDTGESIKEIPTSCIKYIYDNNGANIPNKLGQDIKYSSGIGFPMSPDGTLANKIDSYTTYLILWLDYYGGHGENGLNTCDGSPDIIWDERGSKNTSCANNKWAGAKKSCQEAGYDLPTNAQLQELYCRLKGIENQYYSCKDTTLDSGFVAAMNGKKVRLDYTQWSSEPAGTSAGWFVDFANGRVGSNTHPGGYAVTGRHAAICLGY